MKLLGLPVTVRGDMPKTTVAIIGNGADRATIVVAKNVDKAA